MHATEKMTLAFSLILSYIGIQAILNAPPRPPPKIFPSTLVQTTRCFFLLYSYHLKEPSVPTNRLPMKNHLAASELCLLLQVVVLRAAAWKTTGRIRGRQNLRLHPLSTKSERVFWVFPGGPVAKTLRSQCKRARFDPWSGNQVPHVATESSNATTKDPSRCHGHRRSCT